MVPTDQNEKQPNDLIKKSNKLISFSMLIKILILLFAICLLIAVCTRVDGLGIFSLSGSIILMLYLVIGNDVLPPKKGGNGDDSDAEIKKRFLEFFEKLSKMKDYLPFLVKLYSAITNILVKNISKLDENQIAQLQEEIKAMNQSIEQKPKGPPPFLSKPKKQ